MTPNDTIRFWCNGPSLHASDEDDDLAKAVRYMEGLKDRRLPVINKSKAGGRHPQSGRRVTCCPKSSSAFWSITAETWVMPLAYGQPLRDTPVATTSTLFWPQYGDAE